MPTHTFAFGIGIWELGIVLVIVLLIFGAGKLPGVGAALGKSINAFKKNAELGEGKDEAPDKKAIDHGKDAEAKPIDTTETKSPSE
jgi:sec-independent protein translocase protein TatA